MKFEISQVTKIHISHVEGLDPITVILEDLEPRKGKLTVTCYGDSWTSYWGGMSERSVAEFVMRCGVDYLQGCLSNANYLTVDFDAIRGEIMKARRKGELDFETAREYYDACDCCDDDHWLCNNSEIIYELYDGCPFNVPMMSSCRDKYERKVFQVVKDGIASAYQGNVAA